MLLAIGSLTVLGALLLAVLAAPRCAAPSRLADVERLLRASSLPPATVARVLSRAESRGYDARVLGRWAAVHGCERLALVVDAGVGRSALVGHLEAGTSPDWRALEVFAGLAAGPWHRALEDAEEAGRRPPFAV